MRDKPHTLLQLPVTMSRWIPAAPPSQRVYDRIHHHPQSRSSFIFYDQPKVPPNSQDLSQKPRLLPTPAPYSVFPSPSRMTSYTGFNCAPSFQCPPQGFNLASCYALSKILQWSLSQLPGCFPLFHRHGPHPSPPLSFLRDIMTSATPHLSFIVINTAILKMHHRVPIHPPDKP